MLELNAWRQARSRGQLSHASKSEDDSLARDSHTRAEPFKFDDADRNHDEVDRARQRDELVLPETLEGINTVMTTKEAPRSAVQNDDDADLAEQVDAATESIFSSIFDDVLLSQLRVGAARRTTHHQSQSQPLSTPREAKDAASSTPTPTPSRMLSQPQQVRGMANDGGVMKETKSRQLFIDQTLATLQVHDNCVRRSE